MTETLNGLSWLPKEAKNSALLGAAEPARGAGAGKGAARAREQALTGPEELLKTITCHGGCRPTLEGEVTEHLGRDEHHPTAARDLVNVRNGTWPQSRAD